MSCLARPASLHCRTCASIPRYHSLCYDCDTRIHRAISAPHDKEYLHADLSSLRSKGPLPACLPDHHRIVYSHPPDDGGCPSPSGLEDESFDQVSRVPSRVASRVVSRVASRLVSRE